jgi:glycosyltransferase involved in cell wall biosynthesis
MRIAILGTRGIPARYGGFETFAEELSSRLVQRGHSVTVYCRRRHSSSTYLGVQLRYLPTIRHKYFDTIAHTFVSTLHLLFHRHDVAIYCNAANAVFTWMPRVTGVPVALNVDGLERHRRKWNAAARAWYLASERLSTFLPSAVVSDARVIAAYYHSRYKKQTTFIPYGAEVEKTTCTSVLKELGLEPGQYILYVSRMEPENNALLVREAFEKLETPMKLVLVGDAPHASEYIARVGNTKDPRVILPGAIYGEGYRQLQSHCLAYIQATEVGGTHPALIEAMGRGALTLFLDTPENREVAGGAGIAFTANNLSETLQSVLDLRESEREKLRDAAQRKVSELYSWDSVTDAYEHLLASLLARPLR